MVDDIGRSLNSIEGEGPDPDFVANLRERIVAETQSHQAPATNQSGVEGGLFNEPEEPRMTTKRWSLLALAAGVTLIAAIAVNLGRDEGVSTTADQPESSTTTVNSNTATSETTTPDELNPSDAVNAPEAAAFDPGAEPITEENIVVEPGISRVDAVGTPFSFTLDEPLYVQLNSRGTFVLTHPGSVGPDDREIVFMRLSALSDPAAPNEPLADLQAGWAADDIGGWLDALPRGVIASDIETTTLGGLAATRIDLEIVPGAISCGPGPGFCVGFGTNRLTFTKSLSLGASYRIWVVEQALEEPLAVIVGIASESDREWFDTAEGILSTLAFGDAAPNPVATTPAGAAELPLLGGIRIELTEETFVDQPLEDFGRIALTDSADTEFLTNPRGPDGEVIETIDELVALLGEGQPELTEIEPTTIGGIEARVFEISGNNTSASPILRGAEDERGWFPPPLARLWLVNHPDRGLLMINAESFELDGDNEPTLALVVARTEQLLESLQFIELG